MVKECLLITNASEQLIIVDQMTSWLNHGGDCKADQWIRTIHGGN